MTAACEGCALHARGLAAFAAGRPGAAKSFMHRAVAATPTLAPAWRSLAWLQTIDPAATVAEQARSAEEAGRSTVAAALCMAAWSRRQTGKRRWPKNVTKALRGLYGSASAEALCAPIVSLHASLEEVAQLGLGRNLCAHPGMAASGVARPLSSGERHVDLVKRHVTGYATVAHAAPLARYPAWDVQYLANWRGEYLATNWADSPYLSTAHVGSLNLFAAAVDHACSRGIPGDVLEAGTFRGGTLAVAAAQLLASAASLTGSLGAQCATKRLWAADTFAGIPPLADETDDVAAWPKNAYAASVQSVRAAWSALGLDDGPPLLTLAGRFNETIRAALSRGDVAAAIGEGVPPSAAVDEEERDARRPVQLAVLRIDADTREGTLEALEAAYDAVSAGGVIIVDDFHLRGARQAVHAFRERRGLTTPLLPAVTDYVACDLTPARAGMLAEDEVRRARPGRVFPRHDPLAVGHMLAQNVYWLKEGGEQSPGAAAAAEPARAGVDKSEL